jgi:hypothetical protein
MIITTPISCAIASLGRAQPCRWLTSVGGALLLAALAGCGSEPEAATSRPGSATVAALPGGAAGAAHSTNAPVAGVQSVFHAGSGAGRDPFFPDSSRRATKVADAAPVAPLPLASYLKLVGIRPGTTRPMALINRTVFSPGEEGDIPIVISNQFSKPEVQRVNIRCLEIRRDSVLIIIAGEQGPRELRLAQSK